MTPAGRAELRSVLQGIYDRKSQAFGSAYDYHSGRASRMGFSPEDVVRDYRQAGGEVPPGAAPGRTSPGVPAAPPKSGGWFDSNRPGRR